MKQDPKVIVKIKNSFGPGVFYAISGEYDEDTAEFLVYGLTNIDFSEGNIVYDPVTVFVSEEDFETFNIPFGHVKFEIDTKFDGHVSNAMEELNSLNN
jgi:hypothetical protein